MRNWDNLRIMLAVARAGSPEAAAKELKVDESTVRRRISSLQQELGLTLIERIDHRWHLTRPGTQLAEQAEDMDERLSATLAQFASDDPALSGDVRVGVPEGYGSYVVAPALAELAISMPSLRVELVCFNSPADITRREVDILVATDPPTSGRHRMRRLDPVHLQMYASRGYIRKYGMPAAVDDLPQHKVIGFDSSSQYAHVALRKLAAFPVRMGSGLICTSVVAQTRAVVAGAGIAVLPTYMVEPSFDLVPVLPDEISMDIDLWLLVHSDVAGRARVRVAMDAIIKAAKQI